MTSTPTGRAPRTLARAFVALTALAGAALACSDPQGPDDAAGLAPGIYVLHSLDGASLPLYDADINLGVMTRAETLFVSSPTSYRIAGAYSLRFFGEVYEERGPLEATRNPATGGVALEGVLRSLHGVARRDGDSLVVELDAVAGISHRLVYVTSPAPPAPGPIASLQLTTTDTVVLHGGHIDLRPLVVRGVDATGRWIKDPEFTVETPVGWGSADGELVAPSDDEAAIVRISSGESVTEVHVDVVPDLRAHAWRLSWTCSAPVRSDPVWLGDSIRLELVVDSVRYAPAQPPYDGFPFMSDGRPMSVPWAKAALFTTGTRTQWTDGDVSTSTVRYPVPMITQRADSVVVRSPSAYGSLPPFPDPMVTLRSTSASPRAYSAEPIADPQRSMCHDLGFEASGRVLLEELP